MSVKASVNISMIRECLIKQYIYHLWMLKQTQHLSYVDAKTDANVRVAKFPALSISQLKNVINTQTQVMT